MSAQPMQPKGPDCKVGFCIKFHSLLVRAEFRNFGESLRRNSDSRDQSCHRSRVSTLIPLRREADSLKEALRRGRKLMGKPV